MNDIEKIHQAIDRALMTSPLSDVVCAITGEFVGLMVEIVRREGQDANKEIVLDGGPRNITIHPPKAGAANPSKGGAL
jgi:hypothetical protein